MINEDRTIRCKWMKSNKALQKNKIKITGNESKVLNEQKQAELLAATRNAM